MISLKDLLLVHCFFTFFNDRKTIIQHNKFWRRRQMFFSTRPIWKRNLCCFFP